MVRKTIKAADLFCGAGGSSTGLAKACAARKMDLELTAVNHWDVAIATHSKNHKTANHFCNRIDEVDPLKIIPGGRLDIMIGSPECTHHSNARGGKPMNDQSRSSGWDILRWCEKLYVSRLLLENVKEWESWGPIGANGRPLKSRRGETFHAFLKALESLGYRVDYKVLCCAYYGDPTTRERLFVMARRDGKKIVWPEATHSPDGKITLFGPTKKFKSARSIIDWDLPGKSIFSRKKPLSPTTMARIMAGLKKFSGLEFILPHQHGNDGVDNVRSVEQPLPTVTGGSSDMFVVEPFIVQLNGTEKGQVDRSAKSVNDPVPTLAGSLHSALIEPFLVGMGGPTGAARPKSVDEPLNTVLADNRIGICEPFIVATDNTGGNGSYTTPIAKPLPTQTSKERFAVCEPMLIPQQSGGIARSVKEPVPTVAAKGAIGLAEPFLIPFFGERKGQDPRCSSIDEPIPTVTGQGAGAVVTPFMVEVNHSDVAGRELSRVHSVDNPMSTMTAKNNKMLIEPFLVDAAYGAKDGENDPHTRRAHSVDKPLGTVTGSKSKALCEPYLVKFNRTGGPRDINEPLDTVTTKDRYGLVIPGLEGYILDIRFRMLTPKELSRAMSFPEDYVFTGNREKVVKQIGNAVPIMTSMALCDALLSA